MRHGTEMGDTPCDGDYLGCQYLNRYDICNPESSTYFLDVYAELSLGMVMREHLSRGAHLYLRQSNPASGP